MLRGTRLGREVVDVPVHAEDLGQHSPVVAQGVGRVQALAQLAAQGSRESERSEPGRRSCRGIAISIRAADYGDFPEGSRHAARRDQAPAGVVHDPEDLPRLALPHLIDFRFVIRGSCEGFGIDTMDLLAGRYYQTVSLAAQDLHQKFM